MKRVDITKQDDGYKFEVRENYTSDVLEEKGGFDTLQEAVEAVEGLDIKDDFFLVSADDKQAADSAVAALSQEENVRTASYGESNEWNTDPTDDDLTPQAQIETLG